MTGLSYALQLAIVALVVVLALIFIVRRRRDFGCGKCEFRDKCLKKHKR